MATTVQLIFYFNMYAMIFILLDTASCGVNGLP